MIKLKSLLTASAAALLAIGSMQGRTLTPEEALARLNGNDMSSKAPGMIQSTPELVKTVDTRAGEAALYLFRNSNDGFMVVSANDVAAPLLGYGTADSDISAEMPPQMQWWLQEYARSIAYADSVATALENFTAAKGMKINPLGFAPAARVAPRSNEFTLLTTTWNQSEPFNDKCPTMADGTGNVPTGCVATAMAQVINYHKYPEKSTGTGTATYNGRTYTRSLDVTYDWNNMAPQYWYDYTPAQANAVADLMVTCGYAVQMMYGDSGSGAYDINVPGALIDNFGYDKSAWLYYRDYYTTAEWEDMLLDDLLTNGPVYYTGQSPEGGHAFVCDGYDGNGYFHFNWGWGGYYDGFFAIDALDPAGQGIGGYDGGYNINQAAIMGIRKPVAGSVRPASRVSQNDADVTGSASGNTVTIDGIWYNLGYIADNFNIAAEFEETTTGEKYHSYLGTAALEPMHGFGGQTFAIPSECPDGIYRVQMSTSTQEHPEWLPALHKPAYNPYVTIQISGGVASIYTTPGNEEGLFITGADFTGPISYTAGATYTLTLSNTTRETATATLAPGMIEGNSLVAMGDSYTFTVAAGETRTFEVPFTFNAYASNFEFGKEYTFILFDPEEMYIIHNFGATTVEKDGEQQPEGIVCNSLTLAGAPYDVDPSDMTVTATVTSGTSATTEFIIALWDSGYNNIATWVTDTYTLTAAQPFTFTEHVSYDDAQTGEIYALSLHDAEGNQISDMIEFTIQDSDPQPVPEIVCHSFELEGDLTAINPEEMYISAEVECTNMDTEADFIIAIWDENLENLIQTWGTGTMTLPKGEIVTISGSLPGFTAEPATSYVMTLHDSDGQRISDFIEFTTEGGDNPGPDPQPTPVFECSSFVMDGDLDNINPENLDFTAVVTSTNMDCEEFFYLHLFDGETFEYIGSLQTDSYSFTAGEARTVEIHTSYTDAVRGRSYIAVFADNYDNVWEEIQFRISDQTSIDAAAADATPAEYFNLQGVPVSNPAHGIYIRRQGNKVEKVVIP